MENKLTRRDGQSESLWQSYQIDNDAQNSSLQTDEIYDVLIVGAGITGVSTALLLQKQGKKCVLIDAHRPGFGTTGGTTAHLNTFFDTTYAQVEKDFGAQAAQLLAAGGKEAMQLIRQFVKELAINCDLQQKDALLYAEDEQQVEELEKIKSSSQKVGIAVEDASNNRLAVPFKAVLRFKDQGQFHPTKYIDGLLKEYLSLGGMLRGNTLLQTLEAKGAYQEAKIADNLYIKAKAVVYATHVPPGINIFSFRCAAYKSYVLALKLNRDALPKELIYDLQEPYHYFRTHEIDGQKYFLLGGEDHKTGQEDETKAIQRLKDYALKYFPDAEVAYEWSAQYYVPVDGLPYIGAFPGKKNVYVATGFNGNGMMFGTLSAKIISDQILGVENPYSDLFAPSRLKPIAGFSEFVKENANVAYHFVKDRFAIEETDSVASIKKGEGQVVEIDGQKAAVYRSEKGDLKMLNPICTHAGCVVQWNNFEKTWDCPCHGGRFDCEGNVITGPPRDNLNAIDL